MTETRPVSLVVDLPQDLADDVEDMSEEAPEYLGRAIKYALARRIIFEELAASGGGAGLGGSPRP